MRAGAPGPTTPRARSQRTIDTPDETPGVVIGVGYRENGDCPGGSVLPPSRGALVATDERTPSVPTAAARGARTERPSTAGAQQRGPDMAEATTSQQWYQQRAEVKALGQALTRAVDRGRRTNAIPSLAGDVWQEIAGVGKAEIAGMMVTACRWGELATVDWWALLRRGSAHVTMPKVKRSRRVDLPAPVRQSVASRVARTVALPWHSRRPVADTLRRAVEAAGLRPPLGIQSGTHLVRHLIASGMADEGAARDEIAERLGHEQTTSSAEYIHPIPVWRRG